MNAKAGGSRPIRVLHLRDSPWVDGPGRTIIESGRHFDPDGIDYHIGVFVAHEGDSHPMIDAANANSIAVHRIIDRGGMDFGPVRQVVALVDSLRIQILHSSDLRSRVYAALAWLLRPNLATVTTVHGWIANTRRRRLMRLLDKSLLRQSKRVVMVSDATRALVPRWWLPESKVAVLRNALVLDEYDAGSRSIPRISQQHPGAPTRILNVGRLSPEKGQDLLIRAVGQLVNEHPWLELELAGIGPSEGSLRSLVEELGIEKHVTFSGFVRNMPDLYARCDLLLQSSLTEGLPNVILEAAFMRLPIIATDVGGTREVVTHRHSAWLIPPGSVDSIAESLRHFMLNRIEFALMADRAHERILSQFSFTARTQRMTEIYQALTR